MKLTTILKGKNNSIDIDGESLKIFETIAITRGIEISDVPLFIITDYLETIKRVEKIIAQIEVDSSPLN